MKKRAANLENRGPPLGADELAAVLTPILAMGGHAMPSATNLRILTSKIDIIRMQFETEFVLFRESHAHNEAAYKAINALEAALTYFRPKMVSCISHLEKTSEIQFGDEYASQADIEAVSIPRRALQEYRDAIEAGDRILRDLEAIKAPSRWFVEPPTDPKFVQAWPDVLEPLAHALCEAMPNIGPGKGKGTLDRCLAAIIPSITGETPTLEAINTKRREKG